MTLWSDRWPFSKDTLRGKASHYTDIIYSICALFCIYKSYTAILQQIHVLALSRYCSLTLIPSQQQLVAVSWTCTMVHASAFVLVWDAVGQVQNLLRELMNTCLCPVLVSSCLCCQIINQEKVWFVGNYLQFSLLCGWKPICNKKFVLQTCSAWAGHSALCISTNKQQ